MSVKVWKLLSLVLVVIFALSTTRVVYAVGVTATITVGYAPQGVAYDSAKNEVFVACTGPILANNGNLTSQAGSDAVYVIADKDNSVVTNIPFTSVPYSFGAYGAAYDSSKGEVFVTNEDGVVAVISDASNSIIANITTGQPYPQGVVYDSAKGEIFVVNEEDSGNAGVVSVISDANNAIVASITVGVSPENPVYDSGTGQIFVPNGDGTVSVISDTNNAVIQTITLPTGDNPACACYDPGKSEIFLAYYHPYVEGQGSYSYMVLNDATYNETANINQETASGFGSLAYDPSNGEIFATNPYSNFVTVISDSTNTILGTIDVPTIDHVASPQGLAYDSAKGEFFVSNLNLNTVSVISDSSGFVSSAPTVSASSSSTASPSPTVPEFSSAALILVVVAMAVVVFGAVALTARTRKHLRR